MQDRLESKTEWAYDLPWSWLCVLTGVLSVASIPLVQAVTKGTYGRLTAIHLSVVAAILWAVLCLCCACCALRRSDRDEKSSLLVVSALYASAVLLVGCLAFATVHDFLRPESKLLCMLPLIVTAGCGIAGYGRLSARGRKVLLSRPVKHVATIAVWFIEAWAVTLCVMIWTRPHEGKSLIALTFVAPYTGLLPIAVSYYLNQKAENYGALSCRLRTYVASVCWILFLWALTPA